MQQSNVGRVVLGWAVIGLGVAIGAGICFYSAGTACVAGAAAVNAAASLGQYLITTPNATPQAAVAAAAFGAILVPGGGLASGAVKGGVGAAVKKEIAEEAAKTEAAAAGKAITAELPRELGGGLRNTTVYVAHDLADKSTIRYAGITANPTARARAHADRPFTKPIAIGPEVTRGEARAIEQALIALNGGARGRKGDQGTGPLDNIINSISPKHAYYNDAIAYGT